jgi:hypothetical protein
MVAARIPAAEHGKIQPVPPVGQVGNGHDQPSAQSQDPVNFGECPLGLKQMLKDLGADDKVEGVVWERQLGGVGYEPDVESPCRCHLDRALRNVDTDIGGNTLVQPDPAGTAVTTPHVEAVVIRRHMEFEKP